MKVLLVSMPFGALDRPALGISLLKARLRELGIPCQIRYLTFGFSELIGIDNYVWISSDLPHTAFAGDWAFAESLYGKRPEADRSYLETVLQGLWKLSEQEIQRVLGIRSQAEPFIEHCLHSEPWADYDLVGFTSTFEQNIASLSLARRLKTTFPEISLVFGGANWEGEMGAEFHRRFPFVDFVCTGEADLSFPSLVRRLAQGPPTPQDLSSIPGLIYRTPGGGIGNSGPPQLCRDMDQQPFPDYSDYFEPLTASAATSGLAPTLLMETSRGCWWGAKSHCTFCGLNGTSMAFRSKSGARSFSEIAYLVQTWNVNFVEIVDNIMDMKSFSDFLPQLAEWEEPVQLFYEVKSNLKREQVGLMQRAGVHRIQPGIESLSDRVLGLMRKGTTALRNIQLLKWCREQGISVDWNLLYGFPGETREDYDQTLDLLPAIRHLQPPTACAPIRLDRFSPHFNEAERFGLTHVRPIPPYPFIYPFDQVGLDRIAYYFDFDYRADVDPGNAAAAVVSYVEEWIELPERGLLTATSNSNGALILSDTRSVARQARVELRGLDRDAYEYCDRMRSLDGVIHHLRGRAGGADFDSRDVVEFLESLVANRLMVCDGKHYLSLALRSDRPATTPQ